MSKKYDKFDDDLVGAGFFLLGLAFFTGLTMICAAIYAILVL